MSHSYLLDTNTLSDFIKHPTGKIFSKIQEIGEEKRKDQRSFLLAPPVKNFADTSTA